MTARPTDEEIRSMADIIDAECFDSRFIGAGPLLRLWLAERQAARDGVTEEMVEHAWKVLDDALNGKIDGQEYAYGDPYPMRAALQSISQPQQAVADMKLDKPARIGAATFGIGVPWSAVIGCAQRAYEAKPISEETAKEMRALISAFNYLPEHSGGKPEPWNSAAPSPNGKKEE